AQGLINNGEINPVASFTGALVPGGATVKSAISSGIVSEATDLGMKELSNPGSVNMKDIFTSGVKSAVATPGGTFVGDVVGGATGSSVAGEAGGAVFSNYLSSELENAK